MTFLPSKIPLIQAPMAGAQGPDQVFDDGYDASEDLHRERGDSRVAAPLPRD